VSKTPDDTKNYENTVAWYAKEAMGGRPIAKGPLALCINFGLHIPNSWSRKRKMEAATGVIMPTKKPDSSNIIKAIEDAMNKVVYKDDGQIVDHIVSKRYCMEPHAQITIIELDAKPAPK
jgi:Holliday junction resolvase RusA-like endonuclease